MTELVAPLTSRQINTLLSKRSFRDSCWEWAGCLARNGYGFIRLWKSTQYVHRISFLHFKGSIPTGLEVCHTCDNRKCYNPEHLYVGTRSDNMQDAVRRGRHRAGSCRGEDSPVSKLTSSMVEGIRKRRLEGLGYTALSREFGISRSQAFRIVKGESWRHIP